MKVSGEDTAYLWDRPATGRGHGCLCRNDSRGVVGLYVRRRLQQPHLRASTRQLSTCRFEQGRIKTKLGLMLQRWRRV